MKNLIIAGFIVLAFSFDAFAKLIPKPLDELVKDSDLIVVGTLTGISEYTEDRVNYDVIFGTGEIIIDKVLGGNVRTTNGFTLLPGDRLRLNYIETFPCVYGSHKRTEDEKGIWFLTINDREKIQYADFRSLDDLSKVTRLLRQGISPNKTAKTIKTQNDIEQMFQIPAFEQPESQNTDFCASNLGEPETKRYYPFRAFLVILFSAGLYWLLYRSRFKIR